VQCSDKFTGKEQNRPLSTVQLHLTCLVAPCQEAVPALISAAFGVAAEGADVVDEVQNADKP
jgi:hypothetical protein